MDRKKKTSNGKKVKKKNSSKKRSSKSVKTTAYTVKKGDTLVRSKKENRKFFKLEENLYKK